MDANLDLNTSPSLPDGTAASQTPPHAIADDVSAADLARGYKKVASERIPFFSEDVTGEDPVGNPFTYGGFLGRPQGTAR